MIKEKIKTIVKKPNRILLYIDNKRIIKLKDKTYLKLQYKNRMGKELSLEKPQTFNEKLQWLKLYDRNPEYTKMVDKYEAKKYVAYIIGEEYIIPTLGVYDRFEDINFEILPNQFVIKCTHDSGGLIICKDKTKLGIGEARKKINKSLKKNYYYSGREWPYKNVKHRIIVEKYMKEENEELKDYKFFCFNGKVKFFKIDFDRFINHRANYYDINGKILPFGEEICPPDFTRDIYLPKNLKKMINLAERLSKNIKFLRVDFYEINNKIYFGELTFYPAAGFGRFIPDEYDKILGDMLKLPIEKIEEKDEK